MTILFAKCNFLRIFGFYKIAVICPKKSDAISTFLLHFLVTCCLNSRYSRVNNKKKCQRKNDKEHLNEKVTSFRRCLRCKKTKNIVQSKRLPTRFFRNHPWDCWFLNILHQDNIRFKFLTFLDFCRKRFCFDYRNAFNELVCIRAFPFIAIKCFTFKHLSLRCKLFFSMIALIVFEHRCWTGLRMWGVLAILAHRL